MEKETNERTKERKMEFRTPQPFSSVSAEAVEDCSILRSTIPALKNSVDVQSEEYKRNYEEMKEQMKVFQERLRESRWQGPDQHVQRFLKSGQMLGSSYFSQILFILYAAVILTVALSPLGTIQ